MVIAGWWVAVMMVDLELLLFIVEVR